MKTINYILQGFGFENLADYKTSTFGYILTAKAISMSLIFGILKAFIQDYLGFNLMVFSAFVLLNMLEFRTGVRASKKRKEKVESRKMGRMFLKVGTYLLIIHILHSFKIGFEFPTVLEHELNPFIVLYWAFLVGVIYQLLKSLLENMTTLGYQETDGVLGLITRKFNKHFDDERNSIE